MVNLDSICVAFVEPESPGNIGFLARTMKNFGLSRLILVGGCDLEEEAWAFAMHAKDILERAERLTWRELLDRGFDFYVGTSRHQGHDQNLVRVAIEPDDLGEALSEVRGEVCILFGREGSGLSLDEISQCDVVVTIPSSEEYPTLNVSHAAAIILYHIYIHAVGAVMEKMREASGKEKRVLVETVDRILKSSGLPEHRRRNYSLIFERVINRAFVSGRECHSLIGMVKSISRSHPP